MSTCAVKPWGRDVAEVILAVHRAPSRSQRLAGIAGGLAAAVAASLALFLLRLPARLSSPGPPPTPTLEISLDHDVEPIPPRAPPPPPAPSSTPPRLVAPRAASRAHTRAQPVEPAQAARVLTREVPADEPVDLTADVFVAGAARRYAGGTTTADGASASAGSGRGAPGEPAPGSPGGPGGGPSDRSRPVSLAGESWSCPWPSEAEPLPIDEQAVLIRVVARSDGTVEAVTIVSDPGHGFGEAAASCARRTRFLPARASNGETIRATSPPIRVRFTR